MGSRALVLGGGGSVGIAWEIGVIKGLHDAGLDLTTADLIVGTSAGSVVGAQIALGAALDDLLAKQLAPSNGLIEQAMVFDPQTFMAIAAQWANGADMTTERRSAIGALALAAPTASEKQWIAVFGERLAAQDWPERRLLVTGVDAQSGEFVAWDRGNGVPLVQAVAASCTVPGLFPPVTIHGRRYIDGGVRSGTNADLAHGYDSVVIIAPIGAQVEPSSRLARRQIETEVAGLRAAGSVVEVVFPDAAALAAFGPNLMDVARRGVAAQAGVEQGAAAAQQLATIWTGSTGA